MEPLYGGATAFSGGPNGVVSSTTTDATPVETTTSNGTLHQLYLTVSSFNVSIFDCIDKWSTDCLPLLHSAVSTHLPHSFTASPLSPSSHLHQHKPTTLNLFSVFPPPHISTLTSLCRATTAVILHHSTVIRRCNFTALLFFTPNLKIQTISIRSKPSSHLPPPSSKPNRSILTHVCSLQQIPRTNPNTTNPKPTILYPTPSLIHHQHTHTETGEGGLTNREAIELGKKRRRDCEKTREREIMGEIGRAIAGSFFLKERSRTIWRHKEATGFCG